MSDRARSVPRGIEALAVALIALSAFAAGARAQDTGRDPSGAWNAPTTDAQLERVERLARQHEVAAMLAERALGRQSDISGLATVTAGSLVVLVDPRNRAAAERSVGEAWADIEAAFGDASGSLTGRPLVVRHSAIDRDGSATAGAAALRRDITRRAATAMREQLDPPLQRWLGTYGAGALDHRTMVRLYEELATAPSRLASDCIGGALDACADALVLQEPERPLHQWYDARQRRAIAERWRYRLRPGDPARYDRCIGRDDEACDAVLAALSREHVIAPLSHLARHALVATAIGIGGPEAFARLASSSGRPMEERLVAAAGVTRDSLVAAWRARVLAAQPRAARLQPRLAIPSILTVLCFGFLATRSSRWR